VGARLLNIYYMSNAFTDNPSMISDNSTECSSDSDVDYKPWQKKQRADHAPRRQGMKGKRCLAVGLHRVPCVTRCDRGCLMFTGLY
jgi:hypothetical protein